MRAYTMCILSCVWLCIACTGEAIFKLSFDACVHASPHAFSLTSVREERARGRLRGKLGKEGEHLEAAGRPRPAKRQDHEQEAEADDSNAEDAHSDASEGVPPLRSVLHPCVLLQEVVPPVA